MADSSRPASFWTQANALLRKNLTYQRKHIWTNVRLILVPLFLCLILLAIQQVLDALTKSISNLANECKSNAANLPGDICPIPNPPLLPPMLQVPQPQLRSVKSDFLSYSDLPDKSCRVTGGSCPVTILITGDKQPLGRALSANIFPTSFTVNSSDLMPTLANNVLGSTAAAGENSYADPGISSDFPIYSIQPLCSANSTWPLSLGKIQTNVKCVQGLCLWRNNSEEVNNELFKGSWRGNPAGMTNEIAAAYDLMSTDKKNFNVTIWYNSTYKDDPLTGNVKLVYEKQERLRIIMKMHGLGDGLKYFRLNDYSIQFVFYFVYLNLQIALAFLVSSIFSKVKTVTVVAYILVYGTGLLGSFLFQKMLETQSFPEEWIVALELYPGFALYRGLYEFSQYASRGNGIKWEDLSDSGMGEVLCIMSIEWFLVLIVAVYIDQVFSSGKHPLFFLSKPFKKSSSLPRRPTVQRLDSKRVSIDIDKLDVTQEREKVEKLRNEGSSGHAIVCDNLKKVYPGRDGNPPKLAVRGLYLDVPSGECFGMLGPNGAGKTSFINMMTGLLKPSSGTALVQGLDICNDMNKVYTSMGVCPQHDLLWETLTGREHLLFYGRLKNIKGSDLTEAVEESLKSVSLFDGGVADKPAGNYSGGMKRRLSVAISLIGNPKVVYLDEPSTGLDPASRKNLWNVIKRAKQNTAIILTTHSMEEAEFLCDRLGIFVDGGLQCIGNSKELKSRYGGSYVFTMTTSSKHEEEVERLVETVSPNAKKIYHLAGTQKFELPKQEVRISEVFRAVEKAKSNFTVFAWGLADTTLEDVFIKVARTAQAFISLS
ncbi:hypothetical protein EUTSA_v10023276mg [Eutrema salsugineum]|uniref:ABC transporter domain-containing protein n=1 Tax=Eutrema salsugineum TaxID=72664 RepID=V4KEN5_EUTSA|nr:hypothetical protein EUTSA_v10023276mg [Eutrema salsugineum]